MDKQIDKQMDNQIGNTIYVDPNSDMGKLMIDMNKMEEEQLINSCKRKLNSGEITKLQAINGLKNFMGYWALPNGQYSRTFYYVPTYLNELKGKSDDSCVIT